MTKKTHSDGSWNVPKAHHLVQSSSDDGKALLVAPKAHPMVGKVPQLMRKARLMVDKALLV